MARAVGLDIGDRHIGVAVSDPMGMIAIPREVLVGYTPPELKEYVLRLRQEGISEVVVGFPLTLSGKEGEQARKTREFASALEEIEGLKVILWDERLSSREAARRLREANRKPDGDRVDAQAAAVILQSYLDAKAVRLDVEESRERPEGEDLHHL